MPSEPPAPTPVSLQHHLTRHGPNSHPTPWHSADPLYLCDPVDPFPAVDGDTGNNDDGAGYGYYDEDDDGDDTIPPEDLTAAHGTYPEPAENENSASSSAAAAASAPTTSTCPLHGYISVADPISVTGTERKLPKFVTEPNARPALGGISSTLPDRKSLTGTQTTPHGAPPPLPAPKPLSRRAFRLSHASDAKWQYDGLPLSALKRIFPDHFVDTSRLECKGFCGKKGHTATSCPLSTSDWHSPPPTWLRNAVKQIPREDGTVPAHSLKEAIQRFTEEGTQQNEGNCFLSLPADSLYALPKRLGFWKAIGTPAAQLSWIAFGFQLRFLAPPPMVGFDNHPGAYRHWQFIDEELTKRVARGQFSIVKPEFAKQIHPIDVAPKSNGKLRFILDCRLVNGFLPHVAFKLENLAVVPQIVSRGAWMFSTDLEDAYFHIPIHLASRPHLCFQWRGVVYTTNVLPFGLNLAPWVFTKMIRPVIRYCRRIGVSVLAYLDDFLWSDKEPHVRELVEFARALLTKLGFSVSETKSDWTPTQILQFLGLLVNTESYCFEVPATKVEKIKRAVAFLIERVQKSHKVSAKSIAEICGHILAIRLAVAPARIYTRALYASLNQAPHWNARVTLSQRAMEELRFWRDQLQNYTSHGMIPAQFTTTLHCDASDDGWGAHCHAASAFGYFDPDLCAPHTSSTYRELMGLLHAIKTPEIVEVIRNQRARFILDSSAAVFNLNNGGGPKPDLAQLVKEIWAQCVRIGVDASAEWVSRSKNEYADTLSKYRDRADWMLNRSLFSALDRRWGPHTVDRFASAHNAQCLRFNSRYHDPHAEATDAFRQDWSRENNFCNPDFNDLDRVLAHAYEHYAVMTVIFPRWESATWFIPIVAAASEIVALPAFNRTFIPGPRSAQTVLNAPSWDVWAARVDFRVQTNSAVSSTRQ